jgi:hypothetical protein
MLGNLRSIIRSLAHIGGNGKALFTQSAVQTGRQSCCKKKYQGSTQPPTLRCGCKPEEYSGSLEMVGATATVVSRVKFTMINIKSLIAASLLTAAAAASFAQAPAAPSVAQKSAPAATAPVDAASTPKAQKTKKHAGAKHKKAKAEKKAVAAKPAASAAK